MASDDQPPYEIVLELPELLQGPYTMPNGDLLSIGDTIEHVECGIGKVIRFATYHDQMGILVCVEFPNNDHEMLGMNFIRKVR